MLPPQGKLTECRMKILRFDIFNLLDDRFYSLLLEYLLFIAHLFYPHHFEMSKL
jgi:hypothetical protein